MRLFSCLTIGIIGVALMIAIFHVRPEDRIAYEQLMQSSSADLVPREVQQQRFVVQKEIWFSENQLRLHYQLQCPSSQLVVTTHGETGEVIEKMQQVQCWLQEELLLVLPDGKEAVQQPSGGYLIRHQNPQDPQSWVTKEQGTPWQILRYLKADVGTYFMKTDLFVAENVKIKRYRLKGHELLTSFANIDLLMEGQGTKAEFTIRGKSLNFRVEKLRATFYSL